MKLILLDDHALFGSTLQAVLSEKEEIESFNFVHSAEMMRELLQCRGEDAVVLLDINLNKIGIDDTFAMAEGLLRENPGLSVAFLSGYDLPMYRKKAREIGAKGFFSKDISIPVLLLGLRRIADGGTVFAKEDLRNAESLTEMEMKVLRLAAKGKNREEIGRILYISNRTVGTHLTNIFQKLEVKNITEAVSAALELGYIPPLY